MKDIAIRAAKTFVPLRQTANAHPAELRPSPRKQVVFNLVSALLCDVVWRFFHELADVLRRVFNLA